MSLVAGSYERFIWGFKLKTLKIFRQNPLTLTPLFTFPSHTAPVKPVAVSGSAAASGGADDTIKVYDLSTSAEIGSLTDHSASVTSLSFFSPPSLSFPRNLISASDDGHVCIYDADPFIHLKTIKAHRKGVNDLSVHPSGKLALTVGRDSCLAMLNLVRGRRSFYCRLDKEASIVEFGLGGDKFFMVVEEKVSVHDAEDARLLFEMGGGKRVLCAAPGTNGLLFTGGEDRAIKAWDTTSGKVAYSIEDAHSARVKGIVVLKGSNSDCGDADPYMVASASSDGVIRVSDVRMANKENPKPLAEACTKSRLTCLVGSSLKSHTPNPLSALLCLCKHPLQLQQIHARFILHGLHQNPSLSSTLIHAYANLGHLSASLQVFLSVSDPDMPLYTSFIRCLYRFGEYERILLVFQEMVSKSIHADECVYPFVLSSCSQMLDGVMGRKICGCLLKLGFDCDDFVGIDLAHYSNNDHEQGFRISNGMRLGRFDPDSLDLICMLRSSVDLNSLKAGRCAHSLVIVSGLWKDTAVSTALLTMYSKLGSIKDARLVFDKMPERDCFAWNLMISGYSRNGLHVEALLLVMGMVRSGVRADLYAAIPIISSIGELKSLRWGKQMHAHVIRNGLDWQVSVHNSLIGMYCNCKCSETARRLFDSVANKTVVSWSEMIKGYVNHDCFHDALALLTKMKLEGFRADSITVINILPACVNIGALEQVKNLHGYSIKCALVSFESLNTALLVSYAKCGCIEMARKLFDDVEVDNKDIITWNSMISAYSKHGDWFHCRELFNQMKKSKLKPDHVTFLGLLTSCVNSGFVEEGRECFKEMTNFCEPNQEHYASMVDLLGRAGYVKEASELINTMPFKPDSRVWGPLLSACKMHDVPELAECAAEKLIAMEPKNAGNYILLSNMYAAAGKWDGVAKMRVFLRDRGLRKVPGCSWLEINGKVHEFRVADRSHLNSVDIYTTLENLELEIKDRERSLKRNQIVLLKEFSECIFV